MKYEVHLSDFEDIDIISYAEKNLEMVKVDEETLDLFSEWEIIKYLNENYKTTISKPFYYPNNSLRITSAYEKLLENVDKVPIEKVEELIKDL